MGKGKGDVGGRKKEESTKKEKVAKQKRGNQSQSHQCHLCLMPCLWGVKKRQYHKEK